MDPPGQNPELDLENARKLALVAVHTQSAVVLGDAQGFVEWVNSAFVTLTGFEPEHIVGKPIQEVLRPRESDEMAAGRLRAYLARARPVKLELRVARRSGGPLRLSVEMQPIRDAAGNATHFLVVASDVGAQRDAEEEARRLRDEALEAQRRETVQGLAAGVARKLGPLLDTLAEQSDQTVSELPGGSRALESLQQIRRLALEAKALSDRLETIAGQRLLAARSIDLSDLVVGASGALEQLWEEREFLDLDLAAKLPPIRGDMSQLRELLENLVENAVEALAGEPGRVRIRTGRKELDESTWARTLPKASLAASQCTFLEVSDRGGGIDPTVEGRIFDPFVTTKASGRGLGLATVLGIVQAHRAGLLVHREPHGGTTVTVYFPCSARARRRVSRRREVERAPGRPRRVVLLVEDDEALRERAQRALRRAGFRVITAPHREGLERFRDHAGEIDAVLLAPTLSGADGDETVRRMRLIRPDVRFVLASPYEDDALEEELAEGDVARFLPKPYSPRELVETLRSVLRG